VKKILTIIGARPQFIKAATITRALARRSDAHEVYLHTGQHYDHNMSKVFFEELELPEPKYNLGVQSSRHGEMTARMLAGIESVLIDEQPDWVLVYGDTNSTLAGALAAAKLHVPVAHVEAGLRSFNRAMPEEINRVLTDHIAELLFAPTETAVRNLQLENRPTDCIRQVGDVMFDATQHALDAADTDALIKRFNLTPGKYVAATIHRAENTDDAMRLHTWFSGLNQAAACEPVVMPLHPRTRAKMEQHQMPKSDYPNIQIIDPLSYLEMTSLIAQARLVATDSGGVQKEAYFHRKPGIILRTETEWVELISAGWSQLAPCNANVLAQTVANFQPLQEWSAKMFGDGHAAEAIVEDMLNYR